MQLAWTIGCTSPLLESYDHQRSFSCRIDNPDRDSWWDTSDTNGNGVIDDGETAGPVFDFATLAGVFGGNGATINSSFNVQPGTPPRPTQPAFEEDFLAALVTFRTPPGLLDGIGERVDTGTAESSVPVGRGLIAADGVADDLNGNGTKLLFDDINGDGIHSAGEPFGFDFNDLHTFNVSFDRVVAAPHTETYGVQFSRRHRFTAKQSETQEQPTYFELSYGSRYMRLDEEFIAEATGSLLGRTRVDMRYDNTLIGPQLAIHWHQQRRGWSLDAGTTVMVGYNFAEASQFAIVGQDLIPGRLNTSSTGRPSTFVSKRQHEELASIAELSAVATYPIIQYLNLQFGYRALYLSELRHAGESIDWSLPSLGILNRGANAWLEGLHASVEWRR